VPQKAKTNTKVEICQGKVSTVVWDPAVKPSDIKLLTAKPIRLETATGCLTLQIEYIDCEVRPRIAVQKLGTRPRLTSVNIEEDLKEVNRSFSPYISTETSPQSVYWREKQNALSLITSESFYEEREIGFNLLGKKLAEAEMEEEEEDELHNSFDMMIEGNGSENGEDSSIAGYIQQCSLVMGLRIFKETSSADELISMWKNS
jgi:hypothetical protein